MDLNNAISAATTLAAAGDERINFIVDFFLSSIRVNNSQQYALTVNYEAQVSQSHTDGGGGGWGVRSVSQSVPNRRVGGNSAQVNHSVSESCGTTVPWSVSQSQTVGGRAQVSQSDTDRWGKCPGQSVSHRQMGDDSA